MSRKEMLDVLKQMRPDVKPVVWSIYDDTMLANQVALVKQQAAQQLADRVATM